MTHESNAPVLPRLNKNFRLCTEQDKCYACVCQVGKRMAPTCLVSRFCFHFPLNLFIINFHSRFFALFAAMFTCIVKSCVLHSNRQTFKKKERRGLSVRYSWIKKKNVTMQSEVGARQTRVFARELCLRTHTYKLTKPRKHLKHGHFVSRTDPANSDAHR